jgi:flagellar hook-length control protein FliK
MPSITAAAGGTQQQAPTAVPATTTQGLFSTAQAQFGSGAVSITTTSVVPATVQTQASGQPLTFAESSLWADLAAEFEARIIAATSPLAARLTGNITATTTGLPLAPAEDAANLIAAGSTAEAAGAGAPAPAMVQMPGIAVAGAGAAAASSGTATFAEALAASALTETAARTTQSTESTAEPNSAAIHAAATHHLGQAQAAADAQPAGTSAVPVASQIADAALTAARRPGQSVEMVLQPEGLGTVSLKVTVERGGLSVHLSVDNAGTRDIVQASWPQLQAAFEQRGLSVQALLLDLSGGRGGSEAFQSFQQFTGQQPGQQFGGQQAAGQQRNGSAGTDRSGTAAIGAIDEGPRPQAGVGASARVDYRI